jgi:hypothetical protein
MRALTRAVVVLACFLGVSATADAALRMKPSSIDLGYQAIGSTRDVYFTVTNDFDYPVAITGAGLGGDSAWGRLSSLPGSCMPPAEPLLTLQPRGVVRRRLPLDRQLVPQLDRDEVVHECVQDA